MLLIAARNTPHPITSSPSSLARDVAYPRHTLLRPGIDASNTAWSTAAAPAADASLSIDDALSLFLSCTPGRGCEAFACTLHTVGGRGLQRHRPIAGRLLVACCSPCCTMRANGRAGQCRSGGRDATVARAPLAAGELTSGFCAPIPNPIPLSRFPAGGSQGGREELENPFPSIPYQRPMTASLRLAQPREAKKAGAARGKLSGQGGICQGGATPGLAVVN